ncbi:nuclear transport factor 2 family protein [Pelobacter sp. M08fum]|uniref:Nuclear transport factor 2 family protein n=2 Tax=Pelovirga terrestris TaxID=2771352 RepID=A0A8J6QPL9_9BACT|nr:nuclear transport factor 2 family protein [Pelovirga terrestris]
MALEPALEQFFNTYQRLNRDNLDLLGGIYSDDIRFSDPAHSLKGLPALRDYFAELYANVEQIRFDFSAPRISNDQVFVQWVMRLRHPRLNRGGEIEVPGISCLHFAENGLVDDHRDYFDLGLLLYEQLPLLGPLVRAVKRRFSA